MVKTGPLSPPFTGDGELSQSGFQELIRHNFNTSYPHESFQYDNRAQLQATPVSNYSTPATDFQEELQYASQSNMYTYQPQHGVGLGIPPDGFSHDGYGYAYNVDFQQHPQVDSQLYHTTNIRAVSPAMTPTTTPGSDAIQTRSGNTIKRGLRPSLVNRSKISKLPKAPKPRKAKVKAEKKIAKLTEPLSILTKDWTHVPVVDIGAYVNRPADVRHKEVQEGKVPGKVKRPMNSFMLYRKAYQNRTKNWCLQNNHQVVSQVCGDSWPLEPDELREQYNEWARIERANHQSAHPGYKFSPSKAGTGKGIKRKVSEEPEEYEESDLDDIDWTTGRQTKRRKGQGSRVEKMDPEAAYHPQRTPYGYNSRDSSIEPVTGDYNRSTYNHPLNNPGKQLPAQYDESQLQHGQYYQQQVFNNNMIPGAEDVLVTKATAMGHHQHYHIQPSQQYGAMTYSQPDMIQPGGDIDPALFGADVGYFNSVYAASIPATQWDGMYMMPQDLHGDSLGYVDIKHSNPLHIQNQHVEIVNGQQEGWQVQTLDHENEFADWFPDNA